MNIKKNEYKKNFILNEFIPFTLIIILKFLIILSFLPKPIFNSQRKLQSIEPSQGNNTTNYTIADEDEGVVVVASYIFFLTIGFIIFCFMAVYILIRLSKFPDYIRERRYDLYAFIYFGNNGNLIINIFHTLYLVKYDLFIYYDFIPLGLTSLIYIIGGLYFIVNLIKSNCIQEQFFSWEHLSSITKLPCFVWDLIPLDDYCCMCTTNETDDEDGHIKNNICVYLWNLFFKFLKFNTYLYCVISFYIFYIVFIINWLIIKLIYQIVLIFIKNEDNISQNEDNISQNEENKPEVENEENKSKIENEENKSKVENEENKSKVENEENKSKVENEENKSKVENEENKSKVENEENHPEIENNKNQAGAKNVDHPIIQSGDVNININININLNFPNKNINQKLQPLNTKKNSPKKNNQNSQNEPIKKTNIKHKENFDYLNNENIYHKENFDYLNDENINHNLSSNTDRELNQSKQSLGNPASNKVDNENQNPKKGPPINSDKQSDINDDIAFNYLKYGN